jgi:2-polyprenyl-6-methoxyphenol hydroxylase-like FAD-dependent oxidoreductase
VSGPCLCGDPACPSCGVAMGTYRHPRERHPRERRVRLALRRAELDAVRFCVVYRRLELQTALRAALSTTGGIEFFAGANAREHQTLCLLESKLFKAGHYDSAQ